MPNPESIIKAREVRHSDWLQLSYMPEFIAEGRVKPSKPQELRVRKKCLSEENLVP